MGLSLTFALALMSFSAQALIYGHDDRKDIYEVPWLRREAQAVAVAVPNVFLNLTPAGTWTVTDTENLARSGSSRVCPDERFADQPTMGVCSGFLVGDRYLVTAGHCLLPNGIIDNAVHPFCTGFSWYFDYNLKGPHDFPVANIPRSHVYGCKRVVRAENVDRGLSTLTNDFALIELDRPVTPAIAPLSVSARPPMVNDLVYTIGHPTGLPAKFSGSANVLAVDNPISFAVNLDTEGGNSGGPVLNARHEVIGILVSGPPEDYFADPKGCQRPNHCDDQGLNCAVPATLQSSNRVQRLSAVLPYLPTSAFPQVPMF